MRSVEQQEKMIQEARDNQWTVGNAILNSGLRVSDQEYLLRILQCYAREDSVNLYWGLDTIIRDRFMDIIDEALYGSENAQDEQKTKQGIIFSQEELSLLNDAILCAIQANGEAMKLTTSRTAVEAMLAEFDRLKELNDKVCHMMEDDEE